MVFRSFSKRTLAALVMLVLLVSLCGCTQQTADDEALSMLIPLQKESFQKFLALFAQTHPDVTFDLSAYHGGSASAYLLHRFEANDLTDIVITSYAPEDALQQNTLLDLSGYDFVHNFKASVLSNLSVDGKIYLLECPTFLRGIAYNKTLFEEHGWQVPTSHEEFLALLRQIKADGTVKPMGLQGKYPGTYFTLMTELSHCDFLQTPAGADWMQRFEKGEASSREGFEGGFTLLSEWMEAGALDEGQTVLGDSTLYQKFIEREYAMVYVMGSQTKLLALTEASQDEFGTFPIYGRGEDSEFVATTHGLKVGLSKRLGEPGNEKKLEKALQVMEFLSTEQGQLMFYTGLGDMLPLVGSDTEPAPLFAALSAVVDRGHSAPFLYPGYEDVLALAGEYLREAFYGGDPSGVFAVMDEVRQASLNDQDLFVATVSETLDEQQTAQFVANALQAQGYGDFSLISKAEYTEHFDVAGGANGKLYQGGIVVMAINSAITNLNAQSTVTMSLTGAQVRELLTSGRVLTDDEGHTDAYPYVAAGLQISRDKDGAITSLTLKGEELKDDQTYTVAFSPQDYTAELAEAGNATETGVAWETAYRTYITSLGTITPEHAKP